MHNIRESGRDVARGPLAFIADQAVIMNPILAPLWIAGLFWLFFDRDNWGKGKRVKGKRDSGRYRILGWAYVVMLVTFIVLKGKNYYLAPVYPILFAAGAVAFERFTVQSPTSDVQGSTQCWDRGLLARRSRNAFPLDPFPLSRFTRWLYVALIILAARHSPLFLYPSSAGSLHPLSSGAWL